MNNKPCYIWDPSLINECDRLPAVEERASMVHNLIKAYGLCDNLQVVRSIPATYEELKMFHSELYLNHMKSFAEIEEDYIASVKDEEYGLAYDCPPVSNIYELVSVLGGGSITAAKCLLLGISNIAINWCGGWHHSQRSKAGGFCYINDIVVAIEKLRIKFEKILYIDLDIHHGDGVQDAYKTCQSVFTMSFHKHEPGFYPGTGGIDDFGISECNQSFCNFPLNAFYNDKTLEYAFEKVFLLIYAKFVPDAIVMQCGADALVNDPNGGACLTEKSYITCLRRVLTTEKPVILLGGGGYNNPNAARLWATLTAVAAGVQLDENIPEHDQWPNYGPQYVLPIQPSLTKDLNTEQYLNKCVEKIINNMEVTNYKNYQYFPSKRKCNVLDGDTKVIHKEDNKPESRKQDNLNKQLCFTTFKEDSLSNNKPFKLINDVYEFNE